MDWTGPTGLANFSELQGSRDFSDVTLFPEDKELLATHKAVLTTGSNFLSQVWCILARATDRFPVLGRRASFFPSNLQRPEVSAAELDRHICPTVARPPRSTK